MTKLPMKRIEIIALTRDRKNILERLQRRGIVEVSDCRDDSLARLNTSSSITQFEKGQDTASQALEILNEYAPGKDSLFSSWKGRREIRKDDLGVYIDRRDRFLEMCHALIGHRKAIAESRAAIARTKTQMDALRIWEALDVPTQFQGTKTTRCIIGTLPGKWTEETLLAGLAARIPDAEAIHAEIVSAFKEQTCIAVICHRNMAAAAGDALREMDLVPPSDPSRILPAARMHQFGEDLVKYEKQIAEHADKIRSYASHREDIEFLSDYLAMRKEKYIALGRVGMTKHTFMISGYVAEKYAAACAQELEDRYDAVVSLETPGEDDDVPACVENNGFVSPVEPVMEMYSLPGRKDIDPSSVMAFFYYLFFGLMLSDAGYGIVTVAATAYVLRRFHLEGTMRKTFKMFFYSGLSTIFWGAMFGSWFGDIIPLVYRQFLHLPPPDLAIWLDPVKDPIKLLVASFAFGIVHLFAGLAIRFKMEWDSGQKADAFWDTVPVFLTVLGAAPMAATVLISVPPALSGIGRYVALAGAVLIVLTAGRQSKNPVARLGMGLYGLYGIASGYLGDILSYSRLLALGLATSSIASVINLMGSMPENLVLKGILLTVVFVAGHPLNMAINLLGAYVHTNRLHFVEFFSKFYEGGGRPFQPLRIDSKYIRIKE